MGIKGKINQDHMPKNKYELFIVPIGATVTFTTVSGISEEMDSVDLPDRTRASGGESKATDFTASVPMHHLVDQAIMEAWYEEGQSPVSATYKKTGSLIVTSLSGGAVKSYALKGVWVTGRGLPDFAMENEGEMAEVEWSFSVDDVFGF